MKDLEQMQQQFNENSIVGIDLHHFCLQMWLKAVDSYAEDHYIPDYAVLTNYINKLSIIDKKEWIGHYLTEFAKEINSAKDKIKSCKTKLSNILFKVDSTNIFDCISQTAAIFKQTIDR